MPRRRLAAPGLVVLLALGGASGAAGANATGTAGAPPVASHPGCPTPDAVARLSTAALADATVVVPAQVDDLAAAESAVQAGVGGVLLLGDDPPPDLRAELAALASRAPAPGPLVMVDEEGGSVQRLPALVGSLPSAREMAATMAPAAIAARATGTARRLRALGVDVDLAPVLDLDAGAGPSATDADGTRSFSADPAAAEADGLAFAKGLLAGRVLPVLKHFPGLGGLGNTDVAPASTPPYTGASTPGLLPFAAGVRAGLPAVMVANAAVPGLSALPASVSASVVTGLLRHQLGFRGLVLTDALSAPSLSGRGFDLTGAALAAVRAGADEVLFNAPPTAVGPDVAAIVKTLVGAVAGHRLARSRLVAAVDHAMAAREVIGAC